MPVRFATFNTRKFRHYPGDPNDEQHARRVLQVIKQVRPHVLAVQELPGHSTERADAAMHEIADATGLEYTVGGQPAVACGNHRHAVGLLWQPSFEAIGWRVVHPGKFWHALVIVTLVIYGVKIDVACFHGQPHAGRPAHDVIPQRVAEHLLVAEAMTGPDSAQYGLVGGDWNAISADPSLHGGYYAPDPDLSPTAPPEAAAAARDRQAGQVLVDGGLFDLAAAHGAPFRVTTGHWPRAIGPLRIDLWRGTSSTVRAFQSEKPASNDLTRRTSDHLPNVLTLETANLIG